MKLLAIDTSSHICSACIFDVEAGEMLASETRDIGRGHAEVLMELITKCLDQSKTTYNELNRIGVTIGPGSFTGVRVGMSVARGLGISLNIPVLGITTLDACEAKAEKSQHDGKLVTLLDAKRGQLYCKIAGEAPFAATYAEIAIAIRELNPILCASGAAVLNENCQLTYPVIHEDAACDIKIVAQLASTMSEGNAPPEPLYLRSADARVQSGFALEKAEQPG